MKFFDKKLKVGLATFFGMVLIILEFGILSEFRFTADGLSVEFKSIEKSLGYNFCVMSIVIYLLTVGYTAYLGYRKNWAGLVGMLAIAVAPLLGQLFGLMGSDSLYNVFFGWGTAHLIPTLTLIGLHTASKAVLTIIFAAVLIIYAVVWLITYRARKSYDAKNPW